MKNTEPLTEKEITDLRWEIKPFNKFAKAVPSMILAAWMLLSGTQIMKLKARVAELESNMPKLEQQVTTNTNN